jgi:hypothetical protein
MRRFIIPALVVCILIGAPGCALFSEKPISPHEAARSEEASRRREYQSNREGYYRSLGMPADVSAAKSAQEASIRRFP